MLLLCVLVLCMQMRCLLLACAIALGTVAVGACAVSANVAGIFLQIVLLLNVDAAEVYLDTVCVAVVVGVTNGKW